jgi:hypothetical protein
MTDTTTTTATSTTTKSETNLRDELKKSTTIVPKWGKLDDPRKPGDVIGTVKRYKPFLTRPFGEVELTEFTEIDCKGAVILEVYFNIPSYRRESIFFSIIYYDYYHLSTSSIFMFYVYIS